MTEELEYLKHAGLNFCLFCGLLSYILQICLFVGVTNAVGGGTDKNWRNRRSQKLDKMELLNLQSSLQSEIQAKQTISEDLSKTRAELLAAQK